MGYKTVTPGSTAWEHRLTSRLKGMPLEGKDTCLRSLPDSLPSQGVNVLYEWVS